MPEKGNIYSSIIRKLRVSGELSQRQQHDLNFAMECNGYNAIERMGWQYDPIHMLAASKEFKGQKVAFFGPGYTPDTFYVMEDVGVPLIFWAMGQEAVTDVIRKYRSIDEAQAARIAFILGGIVRHMASTNPGSENIEEETKKAVRFVASMTILGENYSGDAIASAMAMYVISTGSSEKSNYFSEYVYQMSQAVKDDPVYPLETKDLGLSQVARLKNFLDRVQNKDPEGLPDIGEQQEPFAQFPTVGAEFHFPLDAPEKHPNFWQRLAILNMSQYQRGSYVQFSRNDRGVIEVRMNPSIYPVAIADWNHMRLLLPELNQAFFTVTINRTGKDFTWENNKDEALLNKLRAIGFLTYASIFENIPREEGHEEIDFGNIYLGQTVKLHNGNYNFSGSWYGNEGRYGQLALYAGFDGNFPYLAYYLSMALADSSVLTSVANNPLFKKSTLADALSATPRIRSYIFQSITRNIAQNVKLKEAHDAGNKIIQLLNP